MLQAGTPAAFGKLIANENENWTKMIKFVGIKPERPHKIPVACDPRVPSALCRVWVKVGNTRREQMFSAVLPEADIVKRWFFLGEGAQTNGPRPSAIEDAWIGRASVYRALGERPS
jgi:hypothetical protein